MYKRITILILALMSFIACGSYLTANTPAHPLRKSEILALVAGGIFPEDIIHDLESRGIAFAFKRFANLAVPMKPPGSNSALNPFKPLNRIRTDGLTPREEMERQIVDVERFRSEVRQANTFPLDPTL